MNTTRTVGASALVAVLALTLAGCERPAQGAAKLPAVEKERFSNTEVCNTAAWIRERAPAGMCDDESVMDDDLSLRRLHEERLGRSGR